MLILVLGKGKTGSLVAEVARERGHGVRALDINDNPHASALTAPNLAGIDVVIDFTAPEAAVENIRAVLPYFTRGDSLRAEGDLTGAIADYTPRHRTRRQRP